MESAKCPTCGVDLYTAICPNCGRAAASDNALHDESGLSRDGWVREFSLLWYRVRINGGLEDGFVETGWRAGGLAEATTYSRGWWLTLNIGVIAMMIVFTVLLLIIKLLDSAASIGLLMLVTIAFTAVYATIFYYITYVPPKP